MGKKAKLGTNPLSEKKGIDSLITDTREDESKQDKQSNYSKHSNLNKQSKQDNLNNSNKRNKQDIHGLHKKEGPGRPLENRRIITKTSQDGIREGWTRATFIVREDYLDKLKAMAYWERLLLKEVIDNALGAYLKGVEVKSIPDGRK